MVSVQIQVRGAISGSCFEWNRPPTMLRWSGLEAGAATTQRKGRSGVSLSPEDDVNCTGKVHHPHAAPHPTACHNLTGHGTEATQRRADIAHVVAGRDR